MSGDVWYVLLVKREYKKKKRKIPVKQLIKLLLSDFWRYIYFEMNQNGFSTRF